jgi:hypothetical protein
MEECRMTNPNPSPELRNYIAACPFCGSTTGAEPIKDNRKLWAVRCGCGLHGTWNTRRYGAIESWNDRAHRHRMAALKESLSQTPPPPSLSTDVQSAATRFHEHDVSLKVAMPAPGDEGVAEAIDALEGIIEHAETRIQDGIGMGATVWRLALEHIVRDARAAIRLLSQGGGK